jgi:hypothetical protein
VTRLLEVAEVAEWLDVSHSWDRDHAPEAGITCGALLAVRFS